MIVHPIFIDCNGVQSIFEICLTKRLAEKQVKCLNKFFPNTNKKYYTYPLRVTISKKQLFKALKK